MVEKSTAQTGYEMSGDEKFVTWGVIAVSAVVFFATAFSTADNLLKAVVILADLSLGGSLIARLTRAEGWYGLVMLRSKKGFALMEKAARDYAGQATAIAEFGLSLAYGIPYGYYVFRRQPAKLVAHAVALAVFYAWLQSMPAASAWLNEYTLAIGLLSGFLGLGMISLGVATYAILTSKTAVSTVAPVVPGVTLPFWEGLIAIAIVAAVHELAHGVLARVERLPVLSSGLLLFGFLPIGAFVEPDEKKFEKLAIEKKRRILVVGTTSNFVFFLLFLALFFAASSLAPIAIEGVAVKSIEGNSTLAGVLAAGDVITAVNGQAANAGALLAASEGEVKLRTAAGKEFTAVIYQLVVGSVVAGSPAEGKLAAGDVIEAIDGAKVRTMAEARELLEKKQPGQTVSVSVAGGRTHSITLDANKKMGVSVVQSPAFSFENKPRPGRELFYGLFVFLFGVLGITAFLNFALAVVNILPIFTTDGYRIAFDEIAEATRNKEFARKATLALSLFTLALLLVNLGRWFKFF